MARIISLHSFRGGTGKSNTTANLATVLATEGRQVGLVDTDILSPGIHVLFGLDEASVQYSLNDYLWGKCDIRQAVYDVTPRAAGDHGGRIYLTPSSMKAGEITRVLREGYDVGLLNDGFHHLIDDLNLDFMIIDTHPGLNEETLLSIAISDELVIILRPDQQDYQGTGVTVEVARQLDVPHISLLVNNVPHSFDLDEVRHRVEQEYDCSVVAVFPHTDELISLASSGVFALRYPDHPLTAMYRALAARLAG
jgi:MinD-like ATPase involved in chromosome partitioning or flagellar assembly